MNMNFKYLDESKHISKFYNNETSTLTDIFEQEDRFDKYIKRWKNPKKELPKYEEEVHIVMLDTFNQEHLKIGKYTHGEVWDIEDDLVLSKYIICWMDFPSYSHIETKRDILKNIFNIIKDLFL